MSDLTLYQLGPSPNSIKARLALALKGLQFTAVDVNPMDRAPVVEVSGQPLTPVLTHGERVIYDSYAILRYLDANFRGQGPRLFPATTREEMKAIEEWEMFARTKIGAAIGMIFGQAFAPEADPAAIAQANEVFATHTAALESALADQDYLLGAAPTAADLTVAPFASYGLVPAGTEGIGAFFAAHLHMPESAVQTRAWVERVMAIETQAVS